MFVATLAKFLGHVITTRGTEANPSMIRGVANMRTPKVQRTYLEFKWYDRCPQQIHLQCL